MNHPKLTIELIPSTSWYSNVRSEVTGKEWDRLRKEVYRLAGYRCEVCGGKGPSHPVECHEVWEFDDKLYTQKLIKLIALCPACHEVKHIGRAGAIGHGEEAKAQLARVNGWSLEEATAYIRDAFKTWVHRSSHRWELDLSGLDRYK